METNKFNKFVEDIQKRLITDVLIKKGKEYTRGNDRLSNFKRMAAFLQCTPEKALVGAWAKHLASILDMVDDLSIKNVPVMKNNIDIANQGAAMTQWDEKIGDAINYLILLRALVEERSNESGKINET